MNITPTTVRIDPEALRADVRTKYSAVALDPDGDYHFHTGRPLAVRLGYDPTILAAMPDEAVAAFAGVANPFDDNQIRVGDQVLDLGSGGGFDAFVAAHHTGPTGRIIGVDMTPAMLARARQVGSDMGLRNVVFRSGLLEELPVADRTIDVVISNGVINLVSDKLAAFREAHRVLRTGGTLQFADIAVMRTVPDEAKADVGLWTDCIAGGLSVDAWIQVVEAAGFTVRAVGLPVDTFAGAGGESRARRYRVSGHVFTATKTD